MVDIYSDFRADFAPHPVTGNLIRITNEHAIVRSIKNILLTNWGDRVMDPYFGANLTGLLFENISFITQTAIRYAIIDAINNYEPRAALIDVTVQVQPDDNSYFAKITFGIINRTDPITIDQILRRAR